MKNKSLLLILILILCGLQPSFGAFPAKHAVVRNLPVLTTSENTNAPATDYGSANTSLFSTKVGPLLHKFDGNHHAPHSRDNTLGVLSLIFGIAGLATILFGGTLFSIAAIVLGAMGMRHHERHALAGLILGIVGVALILIAIIIFVAIIASYA